MDGTRENAVCAPNEGPHVLPQEKRMLEVIAGGSFAEMAGGIGAIVLAIVGLAGIVPIVLAAIAMVSIGAALAVEGTAIAVEYRRLFCKLADNEVHANELSGGMSAEFFTGIAGVVLGILAIIGVHPIFLLAVSAIVLGIGIAFSSGSKARLNQLRLERTENTLLQRIAKDAVITSIGTDVLAGLGASILGILALLGIVPIILTLVAVLVMGGTILLGGSALGSRMSTLARDSSYQNE